MNYFKMISYQPGLVMYILNIMGFDKCVGMKQSIEAFVENRPKVKESEIYQIVWKNKDT